VQGNRGAGASQLETTQQSEPSASRLDELDCGSSIDG
jgi:hypothetical protein